MRAPVRLPSLTALRAFEAAARHDTLQAAADELHVTHGAVSRQIRQLEDELGEDLFTRRTRANVLNDRGRALATKLHDIFQDLAQALEEFHRDGIILPLSISCEPTLCLKMLIPALGDLKRQTGLDVKVLAAGGPVDFEKDGIDLAIRREDFRIDRNLSLYPLCEKRPVLSLHRHSLQTAKGIQCSRPCNSRHSAARTHGSTGCVLLASNDRAPTN